MLIYAINIYLIVVNINISIKYLYTNAIINYGTSYICIGKLILKQRDDRLGYHKCTLSAPPLRSAFFNAYNSKITINKSHAWSCFFG